MAITGEGMTALYISLTFIVMALAVVAFWLSMKYLRRDCMCIPTTKAAAEELQLLEQNRSHNDVLKQRDNTIYRLELDLQKGKNDIIRLQEQLTEETEAKNNALLRVSELASLQMTNNNPHITNLSDMNRPTKLGEQFSELYDNEWTDTYELLSNIEHQQASLSSCTAGSNSVLSGSVRDEDFQSPFLPLPSDFFNGSDSDSKDRFAIDLLLRFLKIVYTHCKTAAAGTIEIPGVSVELPVEVQAKIKEHRKKYAMNAVPNLYRATFATIQQTFSGESWISCLDNQIVKDYIRRCVELCWLMSVQDPPMALLADPLPGERFNGDKYRTYTKTGRHVDWLVWPGLLLHEEGPMVCKGVVQCCSINQ